MPSPDVLPSNLLGSGEISGSIPPHVEGYTFPEWPTVRTVEAFTAAQNALRAASSRFAVTGDPHGDRLYLATAAAELRTANPQFISAE